MLSMLKRWLAGAPPLPEGWAEKSLATLPLLAVDLELTSLDVREAQITSAGWVEGRGSHIDISRCFYSVVRTRADLAQSPVIHGLTGADIAQGAHIKEVLEQLVGYAGTHLWVCHNANLDLSVLQTALSAQQISCPPVVVLDTLKLAVYQLKKHHEVLPPNSATLTVCRQRLGLPAAPAHNALDDAMATLQLWFAQNQVLNGGKVVSVGDLLHTQAISCKKMEKN